MKTKSFLRLILGVALGLVCFCPMISFATDISVVAGGGLTFPGYYNSGYYDTSSTGRLAGAVGALVEFKLSSFSSMTCGIETGVIYQGRNYRTADKSDATSSIYENEYGHKMFEVPLVFRIHLVPKFSFGAGPYFAYYTGDITATAIQGPFTGQTTTSTYSELSFRSWDFGLIGSAELEIPVLPAVTLTGDFRLVTGIIDMDTRVGNDRKMMDLQLLAGVRLSL